MRLKGDFQRGKEKKEEFVRCCEMWLERCNEALRANGAARESGDAAREAERTYRQSSEHVLAAKEVEEERSKEVAEKVWQTSQK